MAGLERILIFPSRANLVWVKEHYTSAEKGLSLLKRKRDALEIHLKELAAELIRQRQNLVDVMQDAIFSMAKARFLRTDLKPASVMIPDSADVYLHVNYTRIVGMEVPTFELTMRQSNALSLTGLANGGQQVRFVREKFQSAVKILVNVASLQYSVAVLDRAVKQNNMRVNGLEYVILPRYRNTMDYISEELEELEREDFYRLKRSQAKQLKKKAEFIKSVKQRELTVDTPAVDYDFKNAYLRKPLQEIFSARPKNVMQTPRRTVSKIYNKTIIMELEKLQPLLLDPKKTETAYTNDEKMLTTSLPSESSD